MNDIVKTMKYLEERAENIKHFSDALRDNLIKFQIELDSFSHAGVTAKGPVFYEVTESDFAYGEEWSWYFDKEGLWLRKVVGDDENAKLFSIRDAPRRVLVRGIKHLVEFLEVLKKEFDKKERELGEAFAISNKIAAVLDAIVPEDVD